MNQLFWIIRDIGLDLSVDVCILQHVSIVNYHPSFIYRFNVTKKNKHTFKMIPFLSC